MSGAPPLTLHRRLGPGSALRAGRQRAYRALALVDGEPHLVRDELLGRAASDPAPAGRRRALLCLAHLTDLQLADVQSPARFEFFNREFADPRFAKLLPVQRPQEALAAHAVDAMIRTLNDVGTGPVTGAPLELAVTTGDAIDNAQWNELRDFLALLDGGKVGCGAGSPRYEGVQALDWPDDIFWKPDGHGPAGPDLFRVGFGFPHHPGLLEHARTAFSAAGLTVPWLACFGNHEALIQGVGVATPELAEALVSGRKPVSLPSGMDLDRAVELFVSSPHVYLDGPTRPVTPDPDRRAISRRDFVQAHFRPGGRPHGHGFTERNLRDGTAYYVHDLPGIRLIGMDTTCLAGEADGGIDAEQLDWLERRLAEVHSGFRAADGNPVSTGQDDRLVVLFSHHGLETLTNPRHARAGAPVGAGELRSLLHRFPNVVLWLNGHTHTNGVRARVDPRDPRRGFWEVTTCAVADWPCQSRILELSDRGDGLLSIAATMLDHDTPPVPGAPAGLGPGPGRLAALHRELAGNVPWAGFDSNLAGTSADRNVELLQWAPFPIARIPAAG